MIREKHIEGIDPKIAVDWGLPEEENPIRNQPWHRYVKFKNTKVFSPAAEFYKKHKCYTLFPPGTIDYENFWDEEETRCLNGYEVGGIRVTGRHYFYLNYCQIKMIPVDDAGRPLSQNKKIDFPRFLDHNYYYLLELEKNMAEGPWKNESKKGNIVVKGRRKGHTYIVTGAIYAYNYTFIPESMNMLAAGETSHYKVTLDGIHYSINNINSNTAWAKKKLLDQRDHFKAGYWEISEGGMKLEKGFKSEVHAISFSNNPFKSIGESCTVVGFEESGKFSNLITSYNITEPTFREGDTMIGIPIVWGCVCAGTKVWTNEGKLVNIEDLKQSDGILGYDGEGANKEPIVGLNPPAKKQCVRVELTNGNHIECSIDHPLMTSNRKGRVWRGGKFKCKMTFTEANSIIPGDYVAMINDELPFGNKTLKNATLIGLLIGDGNYTKGFVPTLSCGDPEIEEFIESNYSTKYSKFYIQDNGNNYKQFRLPALKEQLIELGLYGQVKLAKRLPSDIHLYNKESVCNLLGGYYDADGNVNYNAKKKTLRVVLTSIVFEMLEEVKYLLLKLGINSNIVKENRNTEPSKGYEGQQKHIYRLYVNKYRDVLKFRDCIPLMCDHKRETLDKILELNPSRKNQGFIDSGFFEINPDNNKGTFFKGKEDLQKLRYETVLKVIDLGEQDIYNMHTGISNTYISNGLITKQTGGDMEGGTADFHEMYYTPATFGIQEYDNIYDINASNKCGYFIDSLWFYPGKALRDYTVKGQVFKKGTLSVDRYGNSIRRLAYAMLMEKREVAKNNKKAYNDNLTQYPLTPAEAFLRTAGTIFDTVKAQQRLSEIEASSNRFRSNVDIGTLEETRFKSIQFRSDRSLEPLYQFPLKDCLDKPGALMIFEHPVKNDAGNVMKNRYIGGIDSYDKDISQTNSVGSILILDRLTDRIVAHFKGRPKAKDFYETCRRMLIYYNAKANYEKANYGIFNYFDNKKCLNLFCDQPEILKEQHLTKVSTQGNGKKGTAPNVAVNAFGLKQAEEWLSAEAYDKNEFDENGEQLTNITNYDIQESEPLLKEIIAWQEDGNFDDISALGMLMIYRADLAKVRVHENEVTHSPLNDSFFTRKLL